MVYLRHRKEGDTDEQVSRSEVLQRHGNTNQDLITAVCRTEEIDIAFISTYPYILKEGSRLTGDATHR